MENNPLTYHELFYANRAFCGVVAMVLGMLIGSFLNVVIWRLPRGESLSTPPSHCPKCGHRIPWYENIPVLSWLCLRARCSSCHQPISWRYPAGETAVGILFLLVYLRIAAAGLPVGHCFACLWLAPLLLAGGMIDLDHRLIPNKLTFFGLGVAALLAVAWPSSRLALACPDNPHSGAIIAHWLLDLLPKSITASGLFTPTGRLLALCDAALGALVGFLLLGGVALVGRLLRGPRRLSVMGGGDVKFLAMTGAFLGADCAVYILFTAAALGFLAGFVNWLAGLAAKQPSDLRRSSLPFGPFLAAAALLWCLLGNFFYNLFQLFAPIS